MRPRNDQQIFIELNRAKNIETNIRSLDSLCILIGDHQSTSGSEVMCRLNIVSCTHGTYLDRLNVRSNKLLVGGIPTPLKNMISSVGMMIPFPI